MPASKKRRKLPEEDLAAAVAEIINSPITRPNLSFLRQPLSLPPESESDLNALEINKNVEQYDSNSLGLDSLPQGFNIKPPEHISRPGGFTVKTSSLSPESRDPHLKVVPYQPAYNLLETQIGTKQLVDGVDPRPVGLGSTPSEFQASFSDTTQKSALARDLPSQTHSWQPQASTLPFWQAEGLSSLFEQSRVKRIRQAQDALSLVEEKVYDLLWGVKNQQKDEFRLVHYSLQRMANEARINIKTVRELIPRLVEKGFLKVEHEADVRRNIPTLYRVFSYSSVLHRQRQHRRFYVVKTGKGVFYVHPVSAALESRLDNCELQLEPQGDELRPIGFKPEGFNEWPLGFDPEPNPTNTIGPLGVNDPKPMGARGHVSIDILVDKHLRQMSTSSWAQLSNSIRDLFGQEPDDQLLRTMVANCHKNAIDTTGESASIEELLYFTGNKANVLSRTPNIRNHLAVLRKAVPECFLGETFRAYRLAAEAKKQKQSREEEEQQKQSAEQERFFKEEQERYSLWSRVSERHHNSHGYDMQAILDDEDLDEKGKEQARGMLQRLGRYTGSGI